LKCTSARKENKKGDVELRIEERKKDGRKERERRKKRKKENAVEEREKCKGN